MKRTTRTRVRHTSEQAGGRKAAAERRQAHLTKALLAPDPFSLENYFRALALVEGDVLHDEPLTA